MPADKKYWREHWQERSGLKDELVVSGWGNRDIAEYLYDLDDISRKLKLRSCDRLLNIGCGNGLMELILGYWVSKIDSVDFSSGMIARARRNNRKNCNVRFFSGNILDLGFLKPGYKKILCNSVIQYLNNLEEVARAFDEIKRVSKKGSRILISANPDSSKMEKFLAGYDRLNLPEVERRRKKKINRLSLWTEPGETSQIAEKAGFKVKVLRMDRHIWQSWYMYDLLLLR